MTRRLDGKVGLVTGASRGLGQAIAYRLSEEGPAVAVHYHGSREGADIRTAGGTAVVVQADATRQAEARRAVEEVLATLGHLDVLVNNAGQHRRADSLEQLQADWDDLIDRNLGATYFFAQAAAQHMKARGGGRIVNISSKMATSTAPGNAAYCAAKAGVAPGVLRTEAM